MRTVDLVEGAKLASELLENAFSLEVRYDVVLISRETVAVFIVFFHRFLFLLLSVQFHRLESCISCICGGGWTLQMAKVSSVGGSAAFLPARTNGSAVRTALTFMGTKILGYSMFFFSVFEAISYNTVSRSENERFQIANPIFGYQVP